MCLTQIPYSLRRREPSDLRTMWLECIIFTYLPLKIKPMLCVNTIGLRRADYFQPCLWRLNNSQHILQSCCYSGSTLSRYPRKRQADINALCMKFAWGLFLTFFIIISLVNVLKNKRKEAAVGEVGEQHTFFLGDLATNEDLLRQELISWLGLIPQHPT